MRGGRWLLVAVAWVAPLAWLALLPFASPSDGTVASAPAAVLGNDRWGESVRVLETYGDTALQPGDQILAVEDAPVAEAAGTTSSRAPGDVLRYRVLRPDEQLDRDLQVEVRLGRYPVGSALLGNPHWVVLALGLLVAGTFLVLRRAPTVLALPTIGAGAGVGIGLSAHPLGVQAAEVSGAAPWWPHLVGGAALALGLGALLAAVVAFPRPPAILVRRRWVLPGLVLLPAVAYAAWLVGYAVRQPAPADLQAQLDIALPAGTAAAVLIAVALATSRLRASTSAEQVAARLLLLGILTAAVVALALAGVPAVLRGAPLVPWQVLALVLVPMLLACWVAAVLGYRLTEIDATLRRSLLQVTIAAVVGAGFLAAANTVNLASGTSVTSMVTGGVVALALLPVALLLRRTASRLAYGDRAFPYRVVSELRRMEPTSAPEDALHEMLALLSRSLRLTYAAIASDGSTPDDRLLVELGERRGEPTVVYLEVGGSQVGRLEMEVSPLREPFGPRDRRLLEDIGTQVGALVQALAAGRELQRARERLVAAREEERRRLRRDLHDGLGPSLATTLMRLEVAKDLVLRDPAEAARLIGELTDQTEADIGEIRRLVDGLRPPALDQLGLVSALRQRAEQHNAAGARGAPRLMWSVVADDLGMLPAAVEVAAYRIAVEGVSNAIRHSNGTRCTVTLRRAPDALEIEIRDDGTGLTEPRGAGVGLGSMRERAEELGGACTVSTPPEGGTLVAAHLPLTDTTGEAM